MEKIVALCKRRGFIFPGSEIYGGLSGTYDLGPFGVELAKNIKDAWWRKMVYEREDVVGLDSSILLSGQVWEASGHSQSFTDPLVECKLCHARFRADQLKEVEMHVQAPHIIDGKTQSVEWVRKNIEWTKPRMFNLMFKTHVGPVEEKENVTYLRPETAQGIFINFDNILQTMRVKLPFGIAQIGKGFRNEITTGNFLFRVREFEMMELEYFVKPEEAPNSFKYWQKGRMKWFTDLGLDKKNLRFREHEDRERAHYALRSVDIEYNWPFGRAQGKPGWGELEGIANRTDYDLGAHSQASGKDLSYFDEETKERIVPYVIEPSVGVGRAMLAFLIDAYHEEKAPTAEFHFAKASRDKKGEAEGHEGTRGEETRVVLKLHPELAPVKVAVLPLVKDQNLVKIAKEIYQDLKKNWNAFYDEVGTIGRRYRRQDEIGTPFAVTVDFDTLKDDSVTIRDRDSMKQQRVKIKELANVSTFASINS